MRLFLPLLILTIVTVAPPASSEEPAASSLYQVRVGEAGQRIYKSHAIAMHGEPKYGPDFTHFDYVNPNAPKGGTLRLAEQGTFDSFNFFIPKGNAGQGSPYESLLTDSADEPFTEYGLIAETIEWPEDRSWVIFSLRPEARWHDGKPITVEDVIWSLETLKTKGHPFYRFYYGSVAAAQRVGHGKRQPRASLDRRATAHTTEALLGLPGVRKNHTGPAVRQRPLSHHGVRGRPLHRDGAGR
jgi:ABC-type oligopeptide transport system substrate-binding subunit